MEQVAQISYKNHIVEIDKNVNQGTVVVRCDNGAPINVSLNKTLGETFEQVFEGCIFEIEELRLFHQRGEFTLGNESQKNNILGREWASMNTPFQLIMF
jgi:hypothetical protein